MESEKILQEQIAKAPKEIRDILTSGVWSQTINQIAQTSNFSDEQKTALENEVLFVLLGMELLSDLQNNIQSSLAITPEITQSTVQKIKAEILNDVEEFLPEELEKGEESTTDTDKPTLALEIPPEDLPAIVPQPSSETTTGKAGEGVRDVARQPTTNPEEQQVVYGASNQQLTTDPKLRIPGNLPTDSNVPTFEQKASEITRVETPSDKKQDTNNIQIPVTPMHYPLGQDPYREPIE